MTTAEVLGDTDFSFEVSKRAGATLLELAGELDLATAEPLQECLTLPELDDSPDVRVDLTRVTFLGSTGIGLLVSACKRTRAAGGSFHLTGSRGIAQRAIEVSGLLDYFGMHRVA